MTFFDFISKNPWTYYLFIGLAIVVLLIIYFVLIPAFHEGREISIFGLKIGPRPKKVGIKGDNEFRKIVDRSKEFIIDNKSSKYLNEVEEIYKKLPDQSVRSLALRAHIHSQLLTLYFEIHGGFMGMGYPGRQIYLEFTIEQLIGGLPTFIDASNQAQLPERIRDFYNMTEPNMYGVRISDEDYSIALQIGIYIIHRIEKITKWVQRNKKNGKPFDSYTESNLQ
jgi:acyl-CoA synthetase (AMP-forming)/AMP-acid ligase II